MPIKITIEAIGDGCVSETKPDPKNLTLCEVSLALTHLELRKEDLINLYKKGSISYSNKQDSSPEDKKA